MNDMDFCGCGRKDCQWCFAPDAGKENPRAPELRAQLEQLTAKVRAKEKAERDAKILAAEQRCADRERAAVVADLEAEAASLDVDEPIVAQALLDAAARIACGDHIPRDGDAKEKP